MAPFVPLINPLLFDHTRFFATHRDKIVWYLARDPDLPNDTARTRAAIFEHGLSSEFRDAARRGGESKSLVS